MSKFRSEASEFLKYERKRQHRYHQKQFESLARKLSNGGEGIYTITPRSGRMTGGQDSISVVVRWYYKGWILSVLYKGFPQNGGLISSPPQQHFNSMISRLQGRIKSLSVSSGSARSQPAPAVLQPARPQPQLQTQTQSGSRGNTESSQGSGSTGSLSGLLNEAIQYAEQSGLSQGETASEPDTTYQQAESDEGYTESGLDEP